MEIVDYRFRPILSADRDLHSLKIVRSIGEEAVLVDLNNHRLVIGEGGVVLKDVDGGVISGGVLTASHKAINFNYLSDGFRIFNVNAVISDNGKEAVGINLNRVTPGSDYVRIALGGDKSNTFSGDVNLTGQVQLNLEKTNNAIAISKNLNIRDGARVFFLRDNQLSKESRVLLSSTGPIVSGMMFVGRDQSNIRAQIGELKVEGRGRVDFSYGDAAWPDHGIRRLVIEDLEILSGSQLIISGWLDKRDFFLVRKGRELDDVLKRIDFEGYDPRTIGKREYNQDYWEIYAVLPEPTAYGVSLMGVGLGAAVVSRRKTMKAREWARMG